MSTLKLLFALDTLALLLIIGGVIGLHFWRPTDSLSYKDLSGVACLTGIFLSIGVGVRTAAFIISAIWGTP